MKKDKKRMIEEYIAKEYPYTVAPYQDGDDKGYMGILPDIPAVVVSGDTKDEVIVLLEDCRREWIHYAVENNVPIPDPSSYIDIEKFSFKKHTVAGISIG